MKNTKIFTFLLIAIISLFAIHCEGPVGPPGRDGLDGLDGDNGNDGANSVIYSPWYTPNNWLGESGDWYFGVTNAAISQNIVESGVMLAYMSVPGDIYANAVRPLPAYAIGCNWDFLIPDYGEIEFTSDAINKPGITDYYFRFVVIPASSPLLSGTLKSKNISDLKNMSYIEICKKFGIPE